MVSDWSVVGFTVYNPPTENDTVNSKRSYSKFCYTVGDGFMMWDVSRIYRLRTTQ